MDVVINIDKHSGRGRNKMDMNIKVKDEVVVTMMIENFSSYFAVIGCSDMRQ